MTNYGFTCPLGRLALEIDPTRKKVHKKIAANFNGWVAAVRKCLADAADGLPARTNLDQLAQLVLTVMEGGVMQARAHRDIGPFDASVEQLRHYFQSLQAMAAQPKTKPVHQSRRRKP